CGAVEDEEEPGVGQRRRRDDVTSRDVDAGEADAGEDADGDEEQELPGTRPHGRFALRRRLGGADHQDVRALPVRPSEPTGRHTRAQFELALGFPTGRTSWNLAPAS